MLSYESPDPASSAPEQFVVEVFSELRAETIQKRWDDVNVILRMSMLTGLQMQLDATLNMLCDMAAEIAAFERALVYFWDEGQELMQLRLARNVEKRAGHELSEKGTDSRIETPDQQPTGSHPQRALPDGSARRRSRS